MIFSTMSSAGRSRPAPEIPCMVVTTTASTPNDCSSAFRVIAKPVAVQLGNVAMYPFHPRRLRFPDDREMVKVNSRYHQGHIRFQPIGPGCTDCGQMSGVKRFQFASSL